LSWALRRNIVHGGSSDRDKKALSPLILYLNKLEEVKRERGQIFTDGALANSLRASFPT